MESSHSHELLDTPLLLHLVRDDALARWALDHYGLLGEDVQPLVAVVSVGEALAIALRLGWGHRRRERLDVVLAHARIVPLDFPGVIEAYARVDAHCRRMGTPIGENDTWIAATANATGARLLTTDKDFDQLHPGFITREWIDPERFR